MTSNLQGLEGALVGLALVVFFIVRQFSTRRVLSLWTVGLPLVLAYFGLQALGSLDTAGWLLLGLNLSLGTALGFVRGATLRVWPDPRTGEALMRGTPLTAALWVATIAVRVVLSFVEIKLGFAPLSSSSAESFLPAAATIAAQVLVVYLRARDLPAQPRQTALIG